MTDSDHAPLEAFRSVIEVPDEEIDLVHAALVAARYEYPDLDPAPVLDRLNEVAERVLLRAGGDADVVTQLQALFQELFSPQGLHLHGARDTIDENYYDPRNSFPHTVIERRVGIPIALSMLLISIAARAGIALGGTAMPLHFLVRVLGVRPPLLIDCYEGGHLLNEEGCRETLRVLSSGRVRYQPEMLELVPNSAVLTRYLNNLKLIYFDEERYAKAILVLDRILLLNPDLPELNRERGMVCYRLGRRDEARRDLENYLELMPNPPDATAIRDLLKKL